MSWEMEEEILAASFINLYQSKPTATHPFTQLEHVDRQIGKAQAGMHGEANVLSYYDQPVMKQKGMAVYQDKVPHPVDNTFLAGMIKISRILRRSVK